ncbi:MAG TPA: SGNH/GDSL hydrolase family protein [Polyangia bacterium]|nr:SGNH/GDSL hydrolase family protein [Polyangia bacterium]
MRRALAAVAVAAALAGGAAAFFLWRRAHTPARPRSFWGPNGEYALSLVDDRGRYLSKLRGPLKLVLDPFTGYRNFPNQQTSAFTIDADGFRGAPVGDDARPKLALLGGSVAFGFGPPKQDDTVAARLQALEPGYRVINGGVISFGSGQELALMVHVLDRFHPQVYVVLDGWNDLALPLVQWDQREGRLGVDRQFLDQLADELARAQSQPAGAERPVEELEEDAFLARAQQGYLDNLDRMSRFARASGARLVVVLQPDVGTRRAHPPEEAPLLDVRQGVYRRRAVNEKYRRFAEAVAAFCRSRAIDFYDLDGDPAFAAEPAVLFYDMVHPNERGHALMAELIHRHLSKH